MSPTSSFGLASWLSATWRVSLLSLLASLAVASVVTGSLGIAHQLIHPGATGAPTVSLGIAQVQLPDTTAVEVASLVFFLTLASVSTSLLTAVNAVLVRNFLAAQTARVEEGGWRYLVLERNLLESWTNHLSLGVQAVAYGVALGVLVGALEWLGLLLSAGLLVTLSMRYWRVARQVSLDLVAVRRVHRDALRERKSTDSEALIGALYQRDTKALRPSLLVTVSISAGILILTLVPMFLTLDASGLVLPVLMLMFWRQKVMEFMSGTGRLAWLLTQYEDHSGGSASDGDEGD